MGRENWELVVSHARRDEPALFESSEDAIQKECIPATFHPGNYVEIVRYDAPEVPVAHALGAAEPEIASPRPNLFQVVSMSGGHNRPKLMPTLMSYKDQPCTRNSHSMRSGTTLRRNNPRSANRQLYIRSTTWYG